MDVLPFLDLSYFSEHWEYSSRKDRFFPNHNIVIDTSGGVISPTAVYFGINYINEYSLPHTITLANNGTEPLVINNIVADSSFYFDNTQTFPISISSGAFVQITAYCIPKKEGGVQGNLNIYTNKKVFTVKLVGAGKVKEDNPNPVPENSKLTLSTEALAYGSQLISTSSDSKRVTVTNNTTSTVTINNISIDGDFTQVNNSTGKLTVGSSFIIDVTFLPTLIGSRAGNLTITYGDSLSSKIVLSGIGISDAKDLPNLSISDGVLSDGTKLVTCTLYPNGTDEITSIVLPSVDMGNTSNSIVMLTALNTVTLTDLPSSIGNFVCEYSTDTKTWGVQSTYTLQTNNVLYVKFTLPASVNVGVYANVFTIKVNALAKHLNVIGTVTKPQAITNRLTITGNQFYLGDSVYKIKAVNWFGTEGTNYTFNGTWARNWKDIINQIKSFGFNTLRIPLSGTVINPDVYPPTTAIDSTLNADLVGQSSLSILDKVINYCGEVGLYIILDYHRKEAGDGTDGTPIDDTHTLDTWVNNWKTLATRYKDNLNVIGSDLYNEPYKLTWDVWAGYAEQCAEAIHTICKDWIIFVEGVGTYNDASYWWGGELEGVKDRPIKLTLENKVCYSPHEYGQSVGEQSWLAYEGKTLPDNWPINLISIWDKYWGYIYKNNIAPVFIGEFGGHFGVDGLGAATKANGDYEKQWLAQLLSYTTNMNLAYWCYNPNSADTGGLVQDDWTTPQQVKLDLLKDLLKN